MLAAFASKRSPEGIGSFPDLQLAARIALKPVLMQEGGGIQQLGRVIWDPGLGSFRSDLGQGASAAASPAFQARSVTIHFSATD